MPHATIRSQELADFLVEGIGEGIPLRQLCREKEIGKSAVYQWMEDDKEFAGRIARARILGYEQISEEILDIADNASNDWMQRNSQDDNGGYALNGEHVQRSKLRIETRLKLLAKWDPKRYGEKVQLQGDAENPIAAAVTVAFVKSQEKNGSD